MKPVRTYYTERGIQFRAESIATALSLIADVMAAHNEEDCVSVRIDLEDGARNYAGEVVSRLYFVEIILRKEEQR